MKDILLNPGVLPLLGLIGIFYLAIAFNYLGTFIRYAIWLEQGCLLIFLITISGATGATIFPFTKFHPRLISNPFVTPVTVIGQITLYSLAIVLLIPLLRHTLKPIIWVFGQVIVKDIFFFSFVVLILLSATWSNDAALTFKTSLAIAEVCLFGVYFGQRFTWAEWLPLIRTWLLLLTVLAFLYGFLRPSVGTDLDGAWVGIHAHKNQFCFLMVLSSLFWFIKALYSPGANRGSILVVLMSLFALNQGGSGAGRVIIVCLIALWFYLGFVKQLPSQWAFTSVILFLIVSVCLTIVVTENLEFIVVDTLNKDLTFTGRTDFWPLILEELHKRPILGFGVDGFWQPWQGANNPARNIIVAKTEFAPPHSHNGFMDLAVDLGYLGLTLFLASYLTTLAKAVLYLGRAAMPVAGVPLLLLTYTLMTNLSETGILGVTTILFFYVVTLTRVSLDT
ncbi:MAG: O-antigen ligase family protein [Spirulinaceae cyanobacterium]